jgi:signal transduction histidine kinase
MKCYLLNTWLLFLAITATAADTSTVRSGYFDISHINWQQAGIVQLNGDWEFYPAVFYSPNDFNSTQLLPGKQFIKVPSFWNNGIKNQNTQKEGCGYGTYRVTILCPKQNDLLVLKLLTVASAYRLYINGQELYHSGKPDSTSAGTIPLLKPAIVPVTPLHDTIEIIMHVANYSDRVGGVWDYISLGPSKNIYSNLLKSNALNFFVAGSFFLCSAYFAILFVFFRRKYIYFYFTVLCIILSIRALVTGEVSIHYIVSIDWEIVRRIEYISLFLTVPVMALFSYQLFPKEFSRKVLYAVLTIGALFLSVGLFASHFYYTYLLPEYGWFLILTACYGLYAYIKASKHKRQGSSIFLISFIIFFFTSINDVLYANLIIESTQLFYVGLYVLVIAITILLSRQFSYAFKSLRIANRELSEINHELHQKNISIKDKNDQLQQLNAEMDILVYRTSHDLKSPLASTLGILQIAKTETDTEKINTYLDMGEKALNRMEFFINDILDFAKNKRVGLDLTDIHFSQLVQQSLDAHEFAHNAKSIVKEIEIKQVDKFISDRGRITMIINNLISNAIKYSDEHKENKFIRISIVIEQNTAILKVSDNGMGIGQEHLDKLFSMFYRATDAAQGTGLGLYMLKETVEKLKGTVSLSSVLNEGTTVTVTLPNLSEKAG